MSQPNSATETSTRRYRDRIPGLPANHFRRLPEPLGAWASSIGLGTYLGHHDEATDNLYRKAIGRALQIGCNVIDTAVNYRCQRSERTIGEVLERSFQAGTLSRDEVVVSTKGGFIPFDGEPPDDPSAYFQDTFARTGVIQPGEVVAGCHCLSPRYLSHQMECSRRNLRLECIDIYYIHNPETQLSEIPRPEFNDRMLRAFARLEEEVAAGHIRLYGTATWNGYRVPAEETEHLDLAELFNLACQAGGKNHHFRVIQLPYSLAMTEAFAAKTQKLNGKLLSPLEASAELGMYTMASASVYQGRATRHLPEFLASTFPGLRTDAQRAIQFVRSTPGLGTALVGMKQRAHVEENLETACTAPVPPSVIANLFGS
ncbi:MAG: aldo/keto reductase [Candidatus Tectomicrobia bacterium]|uniref:Aldo/keto reductase n=1 Tax=Tectimicrobiota bacterium TaxID=2528274 RepID=A0A932M1E4_UNCTE|nr:aldo/keto reductase [Candidatus Tectomicrobia bacterium]